jgi:hypothetical protein
VDRTLKITTEMLIATSVGISRALGRVLEDA